MSRYRKFGDTDDPPLEAGDGSFVGVDMYTSPENIQPGFAQAATNIDFSTQDAKTRGGFVCVPSTSSTQDDYLDTWTLQTTPSSKSWGSVAYGGGALVAVCAGAAGVDDVMRSTDSGVTWSSVSTGASTSFYDITYANGLFVAVGSAIIYTSSNGGLTWTSRTNPNRLWTDIAYGNGLFVVVGYYVSGATNTARWTYSSDGVTWTESTSYSYGHLFGTICYGNGYFMCLGNEYYDGGGPVAGLPGEAWRSSDGNTWAYCGWPGDGYVFTGIAYGVGSFVGTLNNGTSSAVLSTDNGATWDTQTTPSGSWGSVRYLNEGFIATAATGVAATSIMTSALGSTWTARTAASGSNWVNTTATDDRIVAVATTGHPNQVMTSSLFPIVWASGTYSDPSEEGSQYTMLVFGSSVTLNAFGKNQRTINLTSGETVSEQSTVLQCNNQVFIFRGFDEVPLVWDGVVGNEFELATGNIPPSNMALYCQNRLWVIVDKDSIAASDVLDFTVFTTLDNQFNLSTGDSNFLVTMYPFGSTSLIVFKNRSVFLLTGVEGALADVVASEITRQVGAVGINSVVSVGSDLVYMSDRNINLMSLTTTNNSVQHKTLPLSQPIKKLFDRVNWDYGYKVSMGYTDNHLYVALPLDNATACNTVVVHDFITGAWHGEWNFAASLTMDLQGWAVADYLGSQRMHAVTDDGRVFVTDEGPADISGTIVAEISSSMTTRAYAVNNDIRVNRRMWADLGTSRPSFSITGYVDGAGESTELLSAQTYSRSDSWIFNDSAYSLTNSGDDYNRAGRQDYACLCSDNAQCQSGFYPEVLQEYRYPLLFRRAGRLVWIKVANTQGVISINAIGTEARYGDRSSRVQVI
jgi:hypothetical protein